MDSALTKNYESIQHCPDESKTIPTDKSTNSGPHQRHDMSLLPPPPPPPPPSIMTVSTVESSTEGIEETDSHSQLQIISVLF